MQVEQARTADVASAPQSGVRPGGRWRTILPILTLLVLAVAFWAVAPILNALSVGGFTLAYASAAMAIPVGLSLAAVWAAGPWRASDGTKVRADLTGGLAVAAPWLGGAGSMAILATLYGLGFDALALPVGLAAGFLLATLLAPSRRSAGATAGLGLVRSPAMVPGVLLSLSLLVSAEIEAIRLLSAYVAFPPEFSVLVLAAAVCAMLMIAVLAGRSATVRAQSICAGLVLLGLVSLAVMIGREVGGPVGVVPQISYGEAIRDIGDLERALVLAERADPVDLKPFARPYTALSLENVAALASTVMLGSAALCIVLFAAVPRDGQPGSASERAPSPQTLAWSSLVVAIGLVTLPALAAFAKRDLYHKIAMGDATGTTLPTWVDAMMDAGRSSICRRPMDGATDNATCLKIDGAYRLEDVQLTADALVPVMAMLGGLPAIAVAAVAIGWALAALLTGAHVISAASLGRSDRLGVVLAALVAGLGALAALLIEASLLTRIAWALSLVAATLMPPVLIAALAPRAGPLALAAAAISGFAITLYYIVGVTWFPVAFIDTWSNLSNAPEWRLEQLAELRTSCATGDPAACAALPSIAAASANWLGLDTRAAGLPGTVLGLLVGGLLAVLGAWLGGDTGESDAP
ncbi:MAG: hypothetical protein NW217_14600 [Hyphomicrobiaceae bacterium]|nr:hypothetical protein [Hyphomicrobiaceae bacterium]